MLVDDVMNTVCLSERGCVSRRMKMDRTGFLSGVAGA